MSRGPRIRPADSWRPAASFESLRRRAELLSRVRSFFESRGVLEVETPLLAAATVTDFHLASFRIEHAHGPSFLQTSPEFAMKRLLASGSGPIFQICKAFRRDESGRLHNPEFTILEWYRPGWDPRALLDEIEALLTEILSVPEAERTTYAELFDRYFGLDPHRGSAEEFRRAAGERGIHVAEAEKVDRDTWLNLLMSHVVEPKLGHQRPTFVLDFPASQAALARVRNDDPPVAERFEVYVEGVELANGFHELADAREQRQRFENDLARRAAAGLEAVPLDERLLAALAAGFPDCAGVALGMDRLLMLLAGADSLEEVIAFPFPSA